MKLWLLPLLIFCACNQAEKSSSLYPEFPELINQEINLLSQSKSIVARNIFWNGTSHIDTVAALDINWTTELAWFCEIDLNKPAYRGIYMLDDKDGLLSYRWNNTGRRPPVDPVIFRMDDKRLTYLKAEISKISLMNSLHVSLEFIADSSYYMSGEQVLITKSSNLFEVHGKILD